MARAREEQQSSERQTNSYQMAKVKELSEPVVRALDQHFTSLLRQQQQLVSVVQQLAHPQAAVSLSSSSSNAPTG